MPSRKKAKRKTKPAAVDPAPKRPRVNKTELAKRVAAVLQLRLAGAEIADLVQFSAESGWGVEERQLRSYVAMGDAYLAETLEADRVKLVNRHIAQRRSLFARCLSVSDYANARAVLKDEAEMLGLYPDAKTILTGPEGKELIVKVIGGKASMDDL